MENKPKRSRQLRRAVVGDVVKVDTGRRIIGVEFRNALSPYAVNWRC